MSDAENQTARFALADKNAQRDDGLVPIVNVIMAALDYALPDDDRFAAVLLTDDQRVHAGWFVDLVHGTFAEPDAPAPPPTQRVLSPTEFKRLLTVQEKAIMQKPSIVDDAEACAQLGIDPVPTLVGSQRVILQLLWTDVNAAHDIDLDNPETIGGVQKVRDFGVLTEERAARVLSGLPPA